MLVASTTPAHREPVRAVDTPEASGGEKVVGWVRDNALLLGVGAVLGIGYAGLRFFQPGARAAATQGIAQASEGVVRIRGMKSSMPNPLSTRGSGWIAGPGLVVTNDHVVDGARLLTVSGRRAEVLVSDRATDLAVLRVKGLRGSALQMTDAHPEGAGYAAIGYPGGFGKRFVPMEVRGDWGPVEFTAQNGATLRQARFHGGAVGGNSGGPIVDPSGRVVATVSTGNGATTNGVLNEDVRALLERAARQASSR